LNTPTPPLAHFLHQFHVFLPGASLRSWYSYLCLPLSWDHWCITIPDLLIEMGLVNFFAMTGLEPWSAHSPPLE
jgi:hypothetical protein